MASLSKMQWIELGALFALFLFTSYLWTLPLQKNPYPFGESDAGVHLRINDYYVQTDRVFYRVPDEAADYLGYAHLGKGYLPSPPHYYLNLAILSSLTKERFFASYIFIAILSYFIIFSSYLLIRKLFNFPVAIVASFLLAFSMRDVWTYLWGQWPEKISYYLLPVVLYCFYRYTESYLGKLGRPGKQEQGWHGEQGRHSGHGQHGGRAGDYERGGEHERAGKRTEQPLYLYLLFATLLIQYLFHPQGFFHSAAALGVLSIAFMLLKRSWRIFNWKRVIILSLILVVLAIPVSMGTITVFQSKEVQVDKGDNPFTRLFYWYRPYSDVTGTPLFYFPYKDNYFGYWSLPFLIAGLLCVLILALRKKRSGVLMAAWLISLYIMLHLDVFGIGGRTHRSLPAEAHLFFPLMAIGAYYLPQLLPLARRVKKVAGYCLLGLLVVLMISYGASDTFAVFSNAYAGGSRITGPEAEAAEWIQANTPADAVVHIIPPHFNMFKMIKLYAFREAYNIYHRDDGVIKFDYVYFDLLDIQLRNPEVQGRGPVLHPAIPDSAQALGNLSRITPKLEQLQPVYSNDTVLIYKVTGEDYP